MRYCPSDPNAPTYEDKWLRYLDFDRGPCAPVERRLWMTPLADDTEVDDDDVIVVVVVDIDYCSH